ncbi:MAG: DUF3817 domain-containing protein [Pseudomonadota bacterium]
MRETNDIKPRIGVRWRDEPIARLRLIGRVEGTTLVALLFIAVPLKHVFEQPALVSILGPLHGLSFVAYLVTAVDVVSGGGFTTRETMRLLLVSLVPFGPFVNDHFLAHRQYSEQTCA